MNNHNTNRICYIDVRDREEREDSASEQSKKRLTSLMKQDLTTDLTYVIELTLFTCHLHFKILTIRGKKGNAIFNESE